MNSFYNKVIPGLMESIISEAVLFKNVPSQKISGENAIVFNTNIIMMGWNRGILVPCPKLDSIVLISFRQTYNVIWI